jgi:serine/threonine protein kinase
MIPDENAPIDDTLLAALLAADAALAEGRDPMLDLATETVAVPGSEDVGAIVGVLRRLGHKAAPTAFGSEETERSAFPVRLGRFQIEGLLGQGGFGIVYLARDPTLGREVALKVPRPEVLITPEVRRRFLREARAAGGLDHPNIVSVYEVGEAGSVCYIASACCEGPTLSAWLKTRPEPLPPRLAACLIVPLCDAVQHAHDRGVLHRDIKPSNVILAGGRTPIAEVSGELNAQTLPMSSRPRPRASAVHENHTSRESLVPRLTDFGLARIAEETGDETRTGVPLGSPPYMAPEQAAGRNRDVGPATDVYALGATLYEVLTGRAPFRGETTTETLHLVLEAEPVAPRSLRPGLPRDLETICLKCLEKDPARRYATARNIREDLDRYLSHQPIHARPISMRQRVGKWVRRRPSYAAAILLLTMLFAALVGGIAYRNVLLQNHALHLEREVARADANARLVRRHLEAFQFRQAREALDAHQMERAQDILRTIAADGEPSGEARKPGELGFAWHYLMNQAGRDLVVLSNRRSERVTKIALSQDGRTLVTGDEDGTIRLRDPRTGQVRLMLTGHGLAIGQLVFAPQGDRLVSVGQFDSSHRGEVFFWDLAQEGLLTRIDGFTDRTVKDLRFDLRGERLWEVSVHDRDGPSVGLWDVTTEPDRPQLMWRKPIRSPHLPVSCDGSIVALEEQGRRFVAKDLNSRMELGRAVPIEHDYTVSMPSRDGRLLAVGGSRTVSL